MKKVSILFVYRNKVYIFATSLQHNKTIIATILLRAIYDFFVKQGLKKGFFTACKILTKDTSKIFCKMSAKY